MDKLESPLYTGIHYYNYIDLYVYCTWLRV